MSLEQIKKQYSVPSEIGRRVEFQKKEMGTITGFRGMHIKVNFDGDIPGEFSLLHPTWKIKYLNEIKEVRVKKEMTRSQKNYQDYLNSETSETFAEWMNFPRKRK